MVDGTAVRVASAVGRGREVEAAFEVVARLLGWTVAPLGPETELVVVLGGRAPTTAIERARAKRPALVVIDATGLAGLDLSRPALAAIRRGDADWLADLARVRDTLAVPNADLSGARLDCPVPLEVDGADLRGCRITNATLRGAGVDLRDARVEGRLDAHLVDPDARGLVVAGEVLLRAERGRWDGADLSAGVLRRGGFADADLSTVRWGTLRDTTFLRASLDGCDFGSARHPRLGFDGCSLRGARVAIAGSTWIEDCDLTGADLRGSLLAGAWLEGSTLDGADLSGVSLCGLNPMAGPDAVELPPAPCDMLGIRGRAGGLDVAIELRLADTPRAALIVRFIDGADERRVESGYGEAGRLLADVRRWGFAPIWEEVRVSGRATPEAGRRYWAALLGLELPAIPAIPAIPSRAGSGAFDDLLARVRRSRGADDAAWAVALDALQESEDGFGEVVRRCLAGEAPRSAGLSIDRRLRADLHVWRGRALPFVRALRVREPGLPGREVRRLVASMALEALDTLALDEVAPHLDLLLARPIRRLELSGRALWSWQCFDGVTDPLAAEVLRLSTSYVHPSSPGDVPRVVSERFPALRRLELGYWGADDLAGLSVDTLCLGGASIPEISFAGARARVVCVNGWDGMNDLDGREASLLRLDGVERWRLGWTASPRFTDAARERGATVERVSDPADADEID